MGLMKKMFEFCILCQAKACLIMYDEDSDKLGPEIWPQDPTKIQSMIQNYECKRIEKSPKTFQIQDFFDNIKNMIETEISKLHKQERGTMYPTWHLSLCDMENEQLCVFIADVNAKITACDQRNTMLKNKNQDETYISFIKNMSQPSVSNSSQLSFMQNNSQNQQQLMTSETLYSVDEKHVGGTLDSTYQVGGVSNYKIKMMRCIEQDDTSLCYMSNIVHERASSSLQPIQFNFMQNNFQVGVNPNSTDQFGESFAWFNPFDDFEWPKGSNGAKDLSNSLLEFSKIIPYY